MIKKLTIALTLSCLLLLIACSNTTVTDSVTPMQIPKVTQSEPSWRKETVRTDSMLGGGGGPHFAVGREVWVDPNFYTINNVSRGDIVMIKTQNNPQAHDFARIVGLPGETIRIKKGQVYVDGNKLDTFYGKDYAGHMKGGAKLLHSTDALKLNENEYYLIGDLWWRSFNDSRSIGAFKKEDFLGKVVGW